MNHKTPDIPLRPRHATSEEEALKRLKSRRARPMRAPAPHVSKGVNAVTRKILKDEGPGLALLRRRWKDLAGERLSSVSKPIKLSGKKDNLVLTLSISRAAAPLFQHQAEGLRQKLSVQLGGNLTAIKLAHDGSGRTKKKQPFQAPISAIKLRELENGVSGINNKQLSDALLDFGKAVYRQK